ncbi:retinol-binding protein pinta-like isoform X2 [Rhodnius prolixus]|uniref:retinol-binding protein pinta-like isoform X2 n=1 Tax=Rhodnius prolixus TaxID=13249 RepID=UPI003D18C90D
MQGVLEAHKTIGELIKKMLYEYEGPTEEQKDAMLEEVGYSRKQLDSDLEQLKEWLKLQLHLPACRLNESDTFLKNYLIGCKGSLEKAKRKLDFYYTFRSQSEVFETRDPLDPDYVTITKLVHFTSLPKMMKHTRLCFLKLADHDQEKFDFISYFRYMMDGCELGLRHEESCGAKFCLVFDAKGISLSHHIAKVKPLVVKDIIYFLVRATPYRFSAMYFINAPQFLVTTINNLAIPFMPKKMKPRVHIIANGFEELSQLFDKSVLPKDYGGDQPSMMELNYWRDYKVEHREWFLNELSERCDESKRIVTEDPTNPYFGMPGSLKKLIVD